MLGIATIWTIALFGQDYFKKVKELEDERHTYGKAAKIYMEKTKQFADEYLKGKKV